MKFVLVMLAALAQQVHGGEDVLDPVSISSRAFMESCLASGQDVSVCDCAVAQAKQKMPRMDLVLFLDLSVAATKNTEDALRAVVERHELDFENNPEHLERFMKVTSFLPKIGAFCAPELPEPQRQ